jgi:sulfate transport system substrate-binding protein
MYADLNDSFAEHWKARTGIDVSVGQALSRSGKPVQVTLDGLDVTTLALSYDAAKLGEKNRFIAPSLSKFLSHDTTGNLSRASPYTSTIVFLVRKGNPKEVNDWDDLLHPEIEVVMPDPGISASGRWGYLAAWGYALRQPGGNETSALDFVRRLLANVIQPNPEAGRIEAVITAFVERRVGDVLLVWENEAHLAMRGSADGKADGFEIITPSTSIMVEPAVSIADSAAGGDNKSGREVAAAYVDYLYTPQAQDIVGSHYLRPRDKQVSAKYAKQFPALELFTVDEAFGGWQKAERTHFARGAILEQIRSN